MGMLLGPFFSISPDPVTGHPSSTVTPDSGAVSLSLHLDVTHPIYAGHFPGNPVVPGVCQIRMITETLAAVTGKEVRLKEADPVKFLAMIDPRQHPDLTLHLSWKEESDGLIKVTAGLHDGDTHFLKYKAIYSTIP